MKALLAKPFGVETAIRWTARLLAAFFVVLVLLFLVGGGGINLTNLTAREGVLMVWFFTTWAGMVIAWRWELLGGILATTGSLLFWGTEYVATGRLPKSWVFLLMVVPGILFLISSYLHRAKAAQ